jgi:hypothetical protein
MSIWITYLFSSSVDCIQVVWWDFMNRTIKFQVLLRQKISDQLRNYQLLKQNAVSWIYFIFKLILNQG